MPQVNLLFISFIVGVILAPSANLHGHQGH